MSNATTANCTPLPPNFDPAVSFGPWFVGLGLELFMAGVAFDLALNYFRLHAAGDRPTLRVLVTILLIMGVLKSLVSSAIVWFSLITSFGSYELAKGPSQWYSKIHPFLTAVIILIAQTFFLLRLNAVLKTMRWLLVVIVMFMLLSAAGHLATTIELFRRPRSTAARLSQIPALTGLMGADVLLCGAFIYVLIKSKTGIKKTDSVLSRVIFLSFSSAALPMLVDAGKLISVLAFSPLSEAFVFFSLIQSKVYTLAVLVTLIFRGSLRNNESAFFSTETIGVRYPSIHIGEGGDIIPRVVSPPAVARLSVIHEDISNEKLGGLDGHLVDLESGGRRGAVNATVDPLPGKQGNLELGIREQEKSSEGRRKGEGMDISDKDVHEESCECGRRRN